MSIRALHAHEGKLYGVNGNALFSVDSDGTRATIGTLNSTAGPIDFASMLGQLCLTDGSYLYVWDGVALATSPAYPGGERIAFIDQRIVFDIRGTQRFGWTALGNALSIDALDFASAEFAPDNVRAVVPVAGDLWLFGEWTTEPWRSIGGDDVFQSSGNALEYGCAAPHAVRRMANTVTWLARDERGQAMVMSATGYQPRRVSTRAIEERFEGLPHLAQANAYAYSDGGHAFYCLTVPGVDTTLVYDHAFEQWHERAELVNGDLRPWRPTAHAFAYGHHYFGDADGNLYRLDANAHTFDGDPKARIRIAPVLSHPDRARIMFRRVELVCDTATAATVMLRYSNDNGENWGNWRYASTGAIGRYGQRVKFELLGSGRDRVYEVRCTDDAPFSPVQAVMDVV